MEPESNAWRPEGMRSQTHRAAPILLALALALGLAACAAPGGSPALDEADAARLGEFESRLRVLVDEHFLDRGGGGGVIGKQRFKLRREVRQAGRKQLLGVGPKLAVGEVRQAIALRADHAPASGAQPGIQPDQDQTSFSITSSGMS